MRSMGMPGSASIVVALAHSPTGPLAPPRRRDAPCTDASLPQSPAQGSQVITCNQFAQGGAADLPGNLLLPYAAQENAVRSEQRTATQAGSHAPRRRRSGASCSSSGGS